MDTKVPEKQKCEVTDHSHDHKKIKSIKMDTKSATKNTNKSEERHEEATKNKILQFYI